MNNEKESLKASGLTYQDQNPDVIKTILESQRKSEEKVKQSPEKSKPKKKK